MICLPPENPWYLDAMLREAHKAHEVCFVSLSIRVDGRMRAPFWLDPAPDSLSALALRRAILGPLGEVSLTLIHRRRYPL